MQGPRSGPEKLSSAPRLLFDILETWDLQEIPDLEMKRHTVQMLMLNNAIRTVLQIYPTTIIVSGIN